MDQDRNLLFAVFAAQLKRIPPDKIIEIASAWSVDRARSLSERFSEAGLLSGHDVAVIQQLVERAIEAHDNDPRATLATFGGMEQIAQTFHGALILSETGDILPQSAGTDAPGGALESIPGVDETPGRYTHQTEHARGGMGRVLLVHDEHLGRDIALKELLPGLGTVTGSDPASPTRRSFPFVARFLQEARITGQLEHPAIVPVYELGHRLDGSLYYTMKLVRGRTLAEAIGEARGLAGRLKLLPHFVDLCNAIAYAHSRNVIHRDIKPGNIMVGEFGETVVLDWGIAKVLGKEDAHAADLGKALREPTATDGPTEPATEYGQALGTLVYMPPEQARGDLDQIDHLSDIYALGAVLYELLTGATPFELAGLHPLLWRQILIKKVIEELPRPIAVLEPGVPPELAAIAMRALQKDPARRYQSAQELAEEIQRFQTGALVSAYNYNLLDYFRRYARRHRPVVLTAAAAMLLIFALSAAYTVKLRQSQWLAAEAHRKTEETLYRSVMVVVPQYIESDQVALAKKNLWATPERCRGWEWGHRLASVDQDLMNLDGVAVLDARPTANGVLVLAQAAAPDNTLRVWDMNTGMEVTTLAEQSTPVSAAALSPGGERAATVSSQEKLIRIWDLPAGTLLAQIDAPEGTAQALHFTANGDRLTLQVVPAGASAPPAREHTWDARSGAPVPSPEVPPTDTATNHNGTRRLQRSAEGVATLIDATTGAAIAELDTGGEKIASWNFSADGTRIITRTESGTLAIWDAEDGLELVTLEDKVASNGEAFLSGDNAYVLSCNFVSIHVSDALTGKLLFETLREQRARFHGMFIGRGAGVLTLGDGAARIWDAHQPPEPIVIAGAAGEVPFINLNGTRAAVTTATNAVQVFDTATGKPSALLEGHGDHIYMAEFSESGNRLFTASWDKTLRVWDSATGTLLARLDHPNLMRSAHFSSDETRLWVLNNTGAVAVWDIAAATTVAEMRVPSSEAILAAYRPGKRRILTLHEDMALRLWDTDTAACVQTMKLEASGRIRSLYLSPKADVAVTASPKEVQVWDTVHAALVKKIPLKTRVNPDLSPDGTRLAGGGDEANRTAVVYRLEGDPGLAPAAPEFELAGHESGVRCVAFSPDGTRIITGATDKTARVWDAASGDILAILEGHEGAVINAWFTPDGMRAITLTDANTLRIWNAHPYRLDQLPAPASTRVTPYPGTEDHPWKARYHLWKQQRYSAWLAAHPPTPAPAP